MTKKVKSASAKISVVGSDRAYSPTDAQQCCKTDCQSQPVAIRAQCEKGCERWIAFTSLNWKISNRVALKNRCKHACSKGARQLTTHSYYSAPLTASEEAGCHTGCDVYDLCSYEKLENM